MSRVNEESTDRGLSDWLTELTDRIGADKVGELLGSAVTGVARTKATIDKNLDAVLAMANIPSRADYQKVQSKLDSLQGSIMSLSRTVEELRETLDGAAKPRATRRTAKTTTSAKAEAVEAAGSKATTRRSTRKRA